MAFYIFNEHRYLSWRMLKETYKAIRQGIPLTQIEYDSNGRLYRKTVNGNLINVDKERNIRK